MVIADFSTIRQTIAGPPQVPCHSTTQLYAENMDYETCGMSEIITQQHETTEFNQILFGWLEIN